MRALLVLFPSLLYGADGASIVERRCLSCHGPAVKAAGLDLTRRPADGRIARLAERVAKGEMPPAAPLPDPEKRAIEEWVKAGAEWPGVLREQRAGKDWWSLQPLRATGGGIDSWVRSKLTANGLRPSMPADRRTLIRRLSFDLTGLPPAPEEIRAFVADDSPAAYERLVDRLLASPHYGERWARHWLDVVRFAESEGFERDLLRDQAWQYRDWVVRSFNADKPYRDFAREQIAGDVMAGATRDSVVATGFLVWGPVDAVGLTSAVESQRDLVREDYLEEMVGVVAQTFLGLTVNCARCHDHKFDPIPQKDYYRFKSAFQAVWPPSDGEELFPSSRPLLTAEEDKARMARLAAIDARIAAAEAELATLQRAGWRDSFPASLPRPAARWTFDTDARDEIGSLHAKLPAGAELGGGRLKPGEGKDAVTLRTPKLTRQIREKTLEAWVWADKPEKAAQVLTIKNSSGYRGAALDAIQFTGKSKRWENQSTARFRSADGKGAEETAAGEMVQIAITYSGDDAIRIYRNGKLYSEWTPDIDNAAARLQTYTSGDAFVRLSASKGLELDEARLYDVALTAEQIAASFAAGVASRAPAASPRIAELERQIASWQAERKPAEAATTAHIASIEPAAPTRLLRRGDVTQKGEAVTPGALSCLPLSPEFGLAPDAPESERRRKLAEWVAHPANPLFARVIVNRVWHHHFGAGLVENPNDFGYNGGEPSHPELLDLLAAEFIRDGWSLKRLHRRLVLSETYRQASAWNREAAAKDAGNRLLWRYTPRRLEGEAVRDAMLRASGKINTRAGGPSFRPFEAKAQGSYQNWLQKDADDPEWHRRTLYRMNVNSALNPMLESLDCPVPAVKTPKRPSTTTALQTLSLMNDAFANRQARAFAAGAAQSSDPVREAFLLALGREPRDEEREDSRALVERHGLAALCWGLFNSSEFLYVE